MASIMDIMVIMVRQSKLKMLIFGLVLILVAAFTMTTRTHAYTDEEKAQAKAWLSAHGYSPDASGAAAAYQDYLNGKFDEELGIKRSSSDDKGEPPKDIKEKFPAAVSGIISDPADEDDTTASNLSETSDGTGETTEETTTEITTEDTEEVTSEVATSEESDEELEEATEEPEDEESSESDSSISQILIVIALVLMLGVLGFAAFYLMKGKE